MKSLTILISSFDNFSDCWKPYLHGLKKYWPDCTYDIFIITNYKDVEDGRAKAIKVGDDKGWSRNMLEALKHIDTPYIFCTQEDFWIQKPVNTSVIEDYIAIMEQDKADYIRLFPAPPPNYDFPDDRRLGIIADDAPYRTSLQVALWRKTILQELIIPNENPWHFELRGTVRSRKYSERFLCVKRFFDENDQPYHYGVDYVCTAINKGRWSKAAKEYARSEGLQIDFTNRPNEDWWHDFTRSSRFGVFCGRFVYLLDRSARNPEKILKEIKNPVKLLKGIYHRMFYQL